jgi:hypothetical protein
MATRNMKITPRFKIYLNKVINQFEIRFELGMIGDSNTLFYQSGIFFPFSSIYFIGLTNTIIIALHKEHGIFIIKQ